MKEWVEQQKREKNLKKTLEKEEDAAYDQQAKEINRMRGMLEDEMNEKRRQMLQSVKETNELIVYPLARPNKKKTRRCIKRFTKSIWSIMK